MCKISIISPVYNAENYLDDCIKSILNQDFRDFEVLFVNDGSPDNSLEILKEYAKQDKRIKVFSKENEGQGVARNFVLPYAKGDYVLYLDPDDWLEEGALRKIYNKFQEDDYDVIFFNAYNYFQDTGKKNPYMFIDCFYNRFKDGVFNASSANNILFETNGLCFKAYKRSFLVENNIRYSPTKYIEDSEFFIKAVLYAKKMSCLNEFIINYRRHNASSNSTTHKNIEVIRKTFYICENILSDYFSKNGTNAGLLNSFLKNRVQQLIHHFNKVNKSHKREYFYMMKRIFEYVNKKYGNEFCKNESFRIVYENVLNNNWIMYNYNNLYSIFMPNFKCYLEV